MLDGIGAQNFPHRQNMQAMPGFADKLSDADAAALANYLRVTWSGRQGAVTTAAVRTLRWEQAFAAGFAYNPALRTVVRPRLAIYSLPSIGPTCGGSRSR